MLLKDKKVAIIGGGPSGLMLGRLLQQKGVDVTVYERDASPHVRQQGSTLDMHDDTGLKAINAAGLMDEFKKRYRPGADRKAVVDSQLNVLLKEDNDRDVKSFGDADFRPEIDRGPLRDMLVESLHPENIVWNARFVQLVPSGAGWMIHFENGLRAYADLVVAADGANSRIRKYITGIPPVYSGVTSLEGTIPNASANAPTLWKLTNGGSLFALQNGKTIFFISKGDGTLTFLVGSRVPETWLTTSGIDITDTDSLRGWFEKEYGSWHPAFRELFASKDVTIVPRPWYHYPPEQYWKSLPNLTMIGDAAHRIPPYAGEGANQALADALDLYEALCGDEYETVEQAISAFEETMRQRSALITRDTILSTASLHAEANLQYLMTIFEETKQETNR